MAGAPLAERYAAVQAGIAKACALAGRERGEVRLVAVSKFHPAPAVLEIARAGQRDFGENYVQEALAKQEYCSALQPDLRWHMIGHVQSRKAPLVAGAFAMLHTLDSARLAAALERHLAGSALETLIEVNIGGEPQKSGVMPEDLEGMAEIVRESCPHLHLRGLMCLPPVFDSGEAARPYFAKLRKMRDNLEKALGQKLPELSMGMSGDFAGAIAEGATIVRIGTDIFGPRPARKAA